MTAFLPAKSGPKDIRELYYYTYRQFQRLSIDLGDIEYADITASDITNWNAAFGWGDHATAGYLTGVSWGDIAGTLSNQTDLQLALEARAAQENGHASRSASVISFTDVSRTFSIQPTGAEFVYYVDETKFTSTGDTLVIPDAEGLHYIYYDLTGALVSTQIFTPEIITLYAFNAAIYWDATNNEAILVEDERHGAQMDSRTHIYRHVTAGTQYETGLGLINMQVDGSGNAAADAQVGINGGTIWDEDIDHVIANGAPQTLSPVAQIPMFYRSGAAGDWRRIAADDYPVVNTGAGLMAWNEDTGTTWQLTEAGTGDYVLTHLFATGGVNHPIIGIVGQATYSTTNEARVGAENELRDLSLGPVDTLSPEYVPIATLLFETKSVFSNAPKARIISTASGDDYVDWRTTLRPAGASSAGSTIAWGDIAGTLSNQADLQAAFNTKLEVPLTVSDTAPGAPADGDLWLDSTAMALYAYYDDGTSQQWVGVGPAGGGGGTAGGVSVTISDTAPSSPANGDLWYDSSDLNLYVYYDDGTSQQWVDTSGGLAEISNTQITNWDTAYGWGDHALAGYLTSETDPTVPAHVKAITSGQVANWGTAYGWGDHAAEGYYEPGNIVGSVSQSGGAPTGAIIEEGSNANGRYIKYADGTLLCHAQGLSAARISDNLVGLTWTFPSAAVNTAYTCNFSVESYLLNLAGSAIISNYVNVKTTSSCRLSLSSDGAFTSASNEATFDAYFIGRWF